MNKLLVSALLLCWCAALSPSLAGAQVLPPWLLIKHESVQLESPAASTRELVLDQGSAYRQSRARSILAAGAGFVVASAIHAAYAAPMRQCSRGGNNQSVVRSLKAAAVIGAVGLTLSIGGGTWLAVESRRHGHRSSWQQRLGAVGIAALSAVPTQALLFGLLLGDCD